jgi:Uma2 family endonuclease
MASQPRTFLTPEQYLATERAAEYKSEYYAGEMFAMSGAREAHNLIQGNLYVELRRQLRQRACRFYTSDMRVRVNASGLYTYPDATALCGEPLFLDDVRDTLLNPHLIVEILSPSTEAYDRGRKFGHYRTVESLREYLLISAERVSAELFIRQADGRWLLSAATQMEEVLDLQSIGCRIALADLYEDVDLTAAARL